MEQIKRRSRFKARPQGKGRHGESVIGSPAQLQVLDLLNTYDYLPSTYIKHAHRSPGYCPDVMLLLSQEGYIGVPTEGEDHRFSLYRPVVYEIRKKGVELLEQHGRTLRKRTRESFKHKYLASIARFLLDHPKHGIQVKSFADILADDRCPDGATFEMKLNDGRVIKPDGPLFGYSLTNTMFFHFEADRATEPGETLSDERKKTVTSMLNAYTQYFRERGYVTHYGIRACSLLIATITQTRKDQILDLVRKHVPEEYQWLFAVTVLPDFREAIPLPSTELLHWSRVGEPLDILATLEGAGHGA